LPAKAADPLFHPASQHSGVCPLDAKRAVGEIEARLPAGGFPALEKEHSAAIGAMQDALSCCQPKFCAAGPGDGAATCKLADQPTRLTVKGDTVKMDGVIGVSSTASEIFLLEYANWFPMNAVGWGAVDVPKKMTQLLTLHNLQFDYMDRTPYIARRQGSMLLRAVLETLLEGPYSGTQSGPMPPREARFVAFVGHDTNIANLAAMLGTDWSAGEELPDKTAPGGALLFELRERDGERYIAAYYVAQTLKQLRGEAITQKAPPYIAALPLSCSARKGGNTCVLTQSAEITPDRSFQALVTRAYDPACLE
jgi:4-phytase/acid phosphatase